jgi:hypothetical protein
MVTPQSLGKCELLRWIGGDALTAVDGWDDA